MPACSAWLCERSWIRRFAACTTAAIAASGSEASPRPCWKASTAIRAATSPACAPPIPSATTNSGARASMASSFARRWRPVSVPAYCSATRSTSVGLEREFAVADAHAIPGVQWPGSLQQLLVEVGAVGGLQVCDHHDVALRVDARMARRGKRVLEPNLGAVPAAEHDVIVEVVDHPRIVPGSALDHQSGSAVDHAGAAQRGCRVETGRVGGDRLGCRL